jgi:hypothetical protein
VTMVVVTHHHPDHTGGVQACRERFGSQGSGAPRARGTPATRCRGEGGRLVAAHAGPERLDAASSGDPRPHTGFDLALAPQAARAVLRRPVAGRGRQRRDRTARRRHDRVPGFAGALRLARTSGPVARARFARRVPPCAASGHSSGIGWSARTRWWQHSATSRSRSASCCRGLRRHRARLWGWAEMSLLAHLEKLERDHRASRDDRGWRAVAR